MFGLALGALGARGPARPKLEALELLGDLLKALPAQTPAALGPREHESYLDIAHRPSWY